MKRVRSNDRTRFSLGHYGLSKSRGTDIRCDARNSKKGRNAPMPFTRLALSVQSIQQSEIGGNVPFQTGQFGNLSHRVIRVERIQPITEPGKILHRRSRQIRAEISSQIGAKI